MLFRSSFHNVSLWHSSSGHFVPRYFFLSFPFFLMFIHRRAMIQTFLSCRRLRILCPCTLPLQLTPPGTLAAHTKSALVLLHSCPDTVQRHILRETQTSTPLIEGSCTNADPRSPITPTIADCRYRTPLTPRLHDAIIITSYLPISQCNS